MENIENVPNTSEQKFNEQGVEVFPFTDRRTGAYTLKTKEEIAETIEEMNTEQK
jgi:hypothetical protein